MSSAYHQWQARCRTLWEHHRLALVFIPMYVLLSLFAMLHFMNSSFLGERYYKTEFNSMYDGTGHKPFVYRQLIPSLARAVTAVTPEVVQHAVSDAVGTMKFSPDLETWRTTMPWMHRSFPTADTHYPRVVSAVLIYGFMWGYIWAIFALSQQLFPSSPAMRWISPLFGLLLISSFSFPFQYTYDIPVLCLSSLCYLFMAQRRWGAYLAAFAVACINKETSIFLLAFFSLWFFRRLDRGSYINLLVLQYFIYAMIRIALLYIYEDNTGQYLKNHLFRVLPGDWFVTSQYSRILMVAWMFFLMTFQWPKKPAFLKCGLLLLPPAYVAYSWYGMPNEYRVFFDVLPLPLLLGVHTLVECTGLSRSAFFDVTCNRRSESS